MFRLNLSVKDESVFKAAEYVIMNNDCTLKEIAAVCGISAPTAARITRFFLDKGLFYKHMTKARTPNGSRPYRYSINPRYNVFCCTVHGDIIRISVIDMTDKIISEHTITPDNSASADNICDELIRFSENAILSTIQYRLGYTISTTPDSSDHPEIAALLEDRIVNSNKNYPYSKRFISGSSFEFARDIFLNNKEYASEVILYIRFNIKAMYHVVFDKENPDSTPICTNLTDCVLEDESIERLVSVIETAITENNITCVYIDSDDFKHIDDIIYRINTVCIKNRSNVLSNLKRLETSKKNTPSVSELGSIIRIKELFIKDIIRKLEDGHNS